MPDSITKTQVLALLARRHSVYARSKGIIVVNGYVRYSVDPQTFAMVRALNRKAIAEAADRRLAARFPEIFA